MLAVTLAVAAFQAYQKQSNEIGRNQSPTAAVTPKSHWLLGNPSDAGSDPDNFLLLKEYFVASYNNTRGTPNWVSWRLTKDDIGEAPRRNKFSTDVTLPPAFTRISEKDYSNSGFDRGHVCPHGDRSKNQEMSYATFVMTNIIPQAPNVNEKAWNMLEIYCRRIAKDQNARLYITAGPAGQGGVGERGRRDAFAADSVTVPAVCWKVIVIVPEDGTEDLTDVNDQSRVLAVLMPNDNAVGYDWAQYRVSTDQVEKATGYHFFTALPPELAGKLRIKIDREFIERQEPPQKLN